MKKADSPILNLSDLEYKKWQHGRNYAGRMGEIAERIGGEKLGYSNTAIAPWTGFVGIKSGCRPHSCSRH